MRAYRESLTPEEDAAITAAAEADPDNPPLTDEDFARMVPSRGRPRLERPKVPVTLRIDADVVERFKAGGKGWQSRMNEALKKAAG
ncbi:BrnA antitoxin family protein [Chelatococcus sambhunathii]|uniref:BrnA antitoxin family protein n=1 Tax=Chelatococcus sambhunathii TaxID=363953 RepID=A0ABU1DCI0_9HYPH|nr:BrnA antitoxin family protein [Chelatococcus sambhunathii]MDR4305819.1 BrnA antitoxin family protein [Chelatococcus sambhunathii]